MGTRNGVVPDMLPSATGALCAIIGGVLAAWVRRQSLGLDHLPCLQIVGLSLVAADLGAEAVSQGDRCCPSWVRCVACLEACVECSRAFVPVKHWVPSIIARKEDLGIVIFRADLDDLSRRRSRRYVGLVAGIAGELRKQQALLETEIAALLRTRGGSGA